METRSTLDLSREQQERSLFLFVVVVAYMVTFTVASNSGTRYSAQQLILGVVFGVVYLNLGFFDAEILRRLSPAGRNAVFFPLEIAMVLGIGWMLGPSGNWLIGLPLAGIAVERLSPRSRWWVFVGLLLAIIVPILHYSTWRVALINAFIISTAILFVDIVTEFRLKEQRARENAERLASQLEAANRKLAQYATQVEELATMQERNRLAREIHDNLGHYLTIVNVQIEAARLLLASDPKRAGDSLAKAHELVKKGLAGVRESVSALRVSPVETQSLPEAITSLLEEMRATGMTAELQVLGEAREVNEKTALAFYRAAQEGLTNVRKHADASCLVVQLDFRRAGQLRLTVRDDGRGAADTGGGYGLIGLRERLHLLGGDLCVETAPGEGFCLDVTAPLPVTEGE
jgi:signal transduction histidine kinase